MGNNLSVDSSFVETNATKESRIPREQLVEAAQVNPWTSPASKQRTTISLNNCSNTFYS
jgi:hypothetical protein